jgi:c-di-GMP-related signal transduction protein
LQKAGYRLALDDVSPDRDIVKIDMLLTPAKELVELITFFKQRGKTVLAERVDETLEDLRRASRGWKTRVRIPRCLVGMPSLMHVMFQITCSDLLDQLPIRAAIERREGPLGAMLVLAEAVEIQNETTLMQMGLRWPSLERRAVAELQMNAARWVAQWVS